MSQRCKPWVWVTCSQPVARRHIGGSPLFIRHANLPLFSPSISWLQTMCRTALRDQRPALSFRAHDPALCVMSDLRSIQWRYKTKKASHIDVCFWFSMLDYSLTFGTKHFDMHTLATQHTIRHHILPLIIFNLIRNVIVCGESGSSWKNCALAVRV